MSKKRRIVTAVVTVVIAIGAGHLMQYGLAGVDRFQQPAPRPSGLRPARPKANTSSVLMPNPLLPAPVDNSEIGDGPEPPDASLLPIGFPLDAVAPVAVPADISQIPPSDLDLNLDGFGMACEVRTEARAAPAAVLEIDLVATCDPDAAVEVAYGTLDFTTRTDATGNLTLRLPALEPSTQVQLLVGNQPPVTVSAFIPDAEWYDRVALTWSGGQAISVHALELGAAPGSAGHVSARRPQSPDRAVSAEGGFLTRLGDPAMPGAQMAEIYTFPSGRMPQAGVVRLSVLAEVTQTTCDGDVPLRVLQTARGSVLRDEAVAVSFPDCAAVGQILVLKNILRDLKIAQN